MGLVGQVPSKAQLPERGRREREDLQGRGLTEVPLGTIRLAVNDGVKEMPGGILIREGFLRPK